MLKLGDKGERVKCWQRVLDLTPASGVFDAFTESSTLAFQAMYGLKCDGIVGPKTWVAAGMPAILPGAPMVHTAPRTRDIDYVIVHHSDTTTRGGMVRALNAGAKPKSTHYSVDKDGSIHCHADPLEVVTWHCPGANLAGIGVDVIHRRGEAFPDAQVAATGTLLRWLCLVHGLPQVAAERRFPSGSGQLARQAWGVVGHGQLRATRCPDGFPIAVALAG